MRSARVILAAVLLAVLAACGDADNVGTADTGGADEPSPTATAPTAAPTAESTPVETITVTETVTAEPEPAETVTVPADADSGGGGGDGCASLTGGEALAFIFVTTPTPGQPVSSGFTVEGCSNSFEATYQWQLLTREGEVLVEDFGTASCGTGCVGEISFTVDFEVSERQVGALRVFSTSPQDGSDVDVNSVPLILEP